MLLKLVFGPEFNPVWLPKLKIHWHPCIYFVSKNENTRRGREREEKAKTHRSIFFKLINVPAFSINPTISLRYLDLINLKYLGLECK